MNNINTEINEGVFPVSGENVEKEGEILILEIGHKDQRFGIHGKLHKDGCGY